MARRAIAREREVVFIFAVCYYALSLRLMPPIVSLVLSLSSVNLLNYEGGIRKQAAMVAHS